MYPVDLMNKIKNQNICFCGPGSLCQKLAAILRGKHFPWLPWVLLRNLH